MITVVRYVLLAVKKLMYRSPVKLLCCVSQCNGRAG